MSRSADLPDLNVWLALAWPEHSHHHQAVQYWEQQAAEQVLFCTVTALGLVRLVCQPKLMGPAVKTAAEASALLQAFCRQPGVSLAACDPRGWDVFHQLIGWRRVACSALHRCLSGGDGHCQWLETGEF